MLVREIKKGLSFMLAILLLLGGSLLSPLPAAHADVDGDFQYANNGNGTATLTGYTGLDLDFNIPAAVGGLNVVEIADQALWGRTFTRVTIPDGVTRIGHQAFYTNFELAEVSIPDSVTFIGEGVFYRNKLTSVTLPPNLTVISNSSFRINKLTSITIPDNVTLIDKYAFSENELASVTIPGRVTAIEREAFTSNRLTNVTISDSVYHIGAGAFQYNRLANLTIPDSVTTIKELAFADNQLTSLIIPEHVTEIGAGAFANNQLSHVMILNPIVNFSTNQPDGHFSGNSSRLTLYGYKDSTTEAFASVNGHAFQAITADLQNLVLNIPGLTFNPGTYVYNLSTSSDSVIVRATSPVSFAVLKINDTVVANGANSAPISLNEGANSITVDVTIPDGQTVQQYVLNIVSDSGAPTVDLTAIPTSPTNGKVTVNVYVNAADSGISELKWAVGNQAPAFFATGGDVITGTTFTVTDNGTYTTYVKDNAGNETVETITISNIDRTAPTIDLTANPTSPTDGNVTVNVYANDAGSGINELKWAVGNQAAAFFALGGDVITGTTFTVTDNGTYTTYAKDNAGNETVETITISNIDRSSPSDPTSPTTPTSDVDEPSEEPSPRTEVLLDGGIIIVKVMPRDITEVKRDDGTLIEQVSLPDEVMDKLPKLLEKAERPVVRIVIDDRRTGVQVQLPGNRLAEVMSVRPDVVFEAQLNGSSFQLEVNVLDLEKLAAQLGVAVKDLKVNIVITTLSGSARVELLEAARKEGMAPLSQLIEFQLIVSGNGKFIEVTDFGGTYMVKSIVLDEPLTQRNYSAVLYEPVTQSFTFVPAVLASRSDGRSESAMRMPHNSIYAVMETPRITFADIQGHWAKPEIEHLASKRLIKGTSNTDFAPERMITRAEFASLLVRALGIRTEQTTAGNVFEDVAAGSWYAAEVDAAAKAGLVEGMSATRFAPEERITREQMAMMLANTRTIVNDEAQEAGPMANVLNNFADAEQVSSWAQDAIAEAVTSKLIQGVSTDRLAPAESATRAQAAIMLQRFMIMIRFLE